MKVIFLPKNDFSFAFCTFISVICYFTFHHQTISSWFKKLYPGVMSHLNKNANSQILLKLSLLSDLIPYYLHLYMYSIVTEKCARICARNLNKCLWATSLTWKAVCNCRLSPLKFEKPASWLQSLEICIFFLIYYLPLYK